MFPPVFPYFQGYPNATAAHVGDPATYFFVPTYEDHVLMGDMAYNFLAHEADPTSFQPFPDSLGFPPMPEVTYGATGLLPPASSYAGHFNFSDTANLFFHSPPSPTVSQTSSTPEPHGQVSPEPSPTPEPSCRRATPVLNHIRYKWCCSVCNQEFRGKWECKRHIESMGKRSKCVACGRNLNGRNDSLLRHFTTHCRGDVGNLSLEDAFVEV